MITTTFSKQEMLDILYGDAGDASVVRDIITGHGRWSIGHELIFRKNDKLYKTHYSSSATGHQDVYELEVKCVEVEEYTKQTVDYRPVEK